MRFFQYILSILILNIFCFAQKPEVVVQVGHKNPISCVAFSPDGRFIISGSWDFTLKLWDVNTAKVIRTFAHKETVSGAAFSPDGSYVLTGCLDKTLKLWDINTGLEIRTFEGTSPVSCIAYSPDGRYALSGSWDNTLKLWDINTGKEIRTFKGYIFALECIAFSPDGRYAISGSSDNTLKLWDINTGLEIRKFTGHTSIVESVTFSPDGRYALSGSWDNTLKLWDINTGKEIKTFKGHESPVSCVAFSPDGSYAISGSADKTLKLWDINSGKEKRKFEGHYKNINSVAYSPDGKYAISGSADNTLKLWDINTGSEIKTFKGYTDWIGCTALSPNGKFVLTGTGGNTLKLWDITMGSVRSVFEEEYIDDISSLAFSPDGLFALQGSFSGSLNLWDLNIGKVKRKFTESERWIGSVAFSPDGRFGLSGSVDKVILWDINTGFEIKVLKESSMLWINSVAFSPDGNYILSGSNDNIIRLWDKNTGVEIRTFKGHTFPVNSVAFSPDDWYAISGSSDKTLKLWDINTGLEIRTFTGHTNYVESVAFSPDGRFALSGSLDFTLKLWDINTGKEIRTFEGHTRNVDHVAFSPDGRFVISSSVDHTIKIWDINSGNEICTLISFGEKDYLTISPDNYYLCSKNGLNAIAFRIGNHAYSPEQFDLQYNRPDIVLERIGYADPEIIKAYREAYYKRLKKMNFKEEMFNKDFHLPETKLLTEEIPLSTDNKELSFRFSCSEEKSENKLDRVNVFVNDVPVYGMAGINLRERKINDFDSTISIELLEGKNKIQVSCLNDKGVESLKETFELTFNGPEIQSKTYYAGIGVANYQESKLNLKYAVKDVDDMASAFSSNSNTEVMTLTNEQVTRENVLALKEKLMQTKVDDEVIISFSGHGFLSKDYDFYFATYDIDYKNPEVRGISYDELESLLDGIPARKKLLLIDACHSGEVDKEGVEIKQTESITENVKGVSIEITDKESKLGLKNSFELMQELFANLSRGSGAVVISAAGGREYAYEGGEWNNGVFTYCVLKGIKEKAADENKDNIITVNELKNYVSEQVEKLTGGRQKPTSRRENLEFDFRVW